MQGCSAPASWHACYILITILMHQPVSMHAVLITILSSSMQCLRGRAMGSISHSSFYDADFTTQYNNIVAVFAAVPNRVM